MKKTPLYHEHSAMGAKMVDFAGWALPIQYSGILEEHRRTRIAAGLFDLSHMGEIRVKGRGAFGFLQRMATNDLGAVAGEQVLYTPLCYPNGGVVDDLLIYKMSDEDFLLVVNAANTEKDLEWLKKHSLTERIGAEEIEIIDCSSDLALLAIQGPKAEEILQPLVNADLSEIGFYRFRSEVDLQGSTVLISRTGYTGEDGFEIYLDSGEAIRIWRMLLKAGEEEGLVPVGLGARDTLRLEAALPLYGQELSPEISPLEAGLGSFVKLQKEDFIGREALLKQKEAGTPRALVGVEMIERGIPRAGYKVLAGGAEIGVVTSGNFSPSLEKNIGLALASKEYASPGTKVEILIRNKPVAAQVIKKPFYRKKYKRF